MDSRVEKMADVIVNYSMAVQPGDKVLIRSTSPAGQPLTQALYQASLRAGGETFTYVHLTDEFHGPQPVIKVIAQKVLQKSLHFESDPFRHFDAFGFLERRLLDM